MSNLTGSVDLVREREQERQARQQLLDEFRDPSPQPIFSQPIKVELEDETSRRIKDTLGDFNQLQHVLINDPKHLIGISRSGAAAAANNAAATAASRSSASVDHGGGGSTTWSSRNHATSNGLSRSGGSNIPNGHHTVTKRPHQVNGLHKPPAGLDSSSLTSRRPHPSANLKSGATIDKKQPQHGPPKHRSEHPPKINPISRGYSSSVGHLDQQPPPPQDNGTRVSNQDRSNRSSYHPPPGVSVASDKEIDNYSKHRRTSSSSSTGSSAISVNSEKPVVSQNGTTSSTSLPNGVIKHHRFPRMPDATAKRIPMAGGGKHPPLPPKLIIPTQEDRSSEIDVETILREMKQAVPPPLTGIQTPKPESGFSFPTENREKDFSRVLEQLGHHALPTTPPSAPPSRIPTTASKKSPQHPSNSPFNLQEDLEMSDSDDEGSMVPTCKSPSASKNDPHSKCPPQPPMSHDESSGLGVDRVSNCVQGNPQSSTKKTTGVASGGSSNGASGPALSAQSSSSESSGSESDSESESNDDSDSSASSEASLQETSPANKITASKQQWNLLTFYDETKRNHSPAFMALDTNTNSNISTVVKEEPRPASVQLPDKDAFSLVDDDRVGGMLEDHGVKNCLESPREDFPLDIKSEVLSPIPKSPKCVPRGPRTPPSPPSGDSSEDEEDNHPIKNIPPKYDARKPVAPKSETQSETKNEPCRQTSRTSEHNSHRSRSEQFLNSRSKKKSSSRTKESAQTSAEYNHRSDGQFHLESHNSASSNSRNISRAAFSDDNNTSGISHPFVNSSSCPVPSSTTPVPKSTHTNPAKSHHKHSSPATTASSSSFSSPKKKTSSESKEGIKSGHHSSRTKSSRSKASVEQKETSNVKNNSHSKSEKESFPVSDSSTKHSRHDTSLDVKSKRNSSPTKAKSITSTKVSRSQMSPCKSSTPKKSKTKPVKSSSSKSSSHNGEERKKLEKKKKFTKFSIKNFVQNPSSPVPESRQPAEVKKSPSSPLRASESEEDSPPPPPPPIKVPKKSSESVLSLEKMQIEDKSMEPTVDQSQNVIPKRKSSNHRRSSTSSSSRSRSRSDSRTCHLSTEKSKLKKRSSKSIKRRGSKSSISDPNSSSSTKKKHYRDVRQSRKSVQKSSVSSSSPVSPHNSNHHSPVSSTLGLDLPSHPPELLSPISASENVESAITFPSSPLPSPVMVSILFSKLLRIPEGHHLISPPTLKPPKDRPEDLCLQRMSTTSSPLPYPEVAPPTSKPSSSERRTSSSLSPCKKDIKTKPRTESSKSSKSGSDHKSVEKSSKTASHCQSESVSHNKSWGANVTSTGSRDKSSSKSSGDAGFKPSKTGQDCPNVVVKKRKVDESGSEPSKKKPKVVVLKSSPTPEVECKDKTVVAKVDKPDIIPTSEKRSTPKRLERCDSTSSLSSLCSQLSHKSSKSLKERSKESLKDSQETKKVKSILPPAKEIKREKEEKPKIVKKSPSSVIKVEKIKSKSKERSSIKGSSSCESKKAPEISQSEGHTASSQIIYREDTCKIEETKPQPTNHQRLLPGDQDPGSDWEHFAPEVQQELRGVPNHINKVSVPAPSEYYWQEGKKLKNMAEKEKNPIQQALKYFEATVMFILTSLHRELTNKDPDSIYQIYRDTLKFSNVIRSGIQKRLSHSTPGNIDFKILVLCLKCQSLLHLKLYNLKIKEIKEQHKGVTDFMHSSSSKLGSHSSPMSSGSSYSRNMSQPSPCQPRIGGGGAASVPSPHSPTPSPAGSVASVGSQSSGYSSSEVNGNHSRNHSGTLLQLPQHIPQLGAVSVPQNMFDVMAKHHSHLSNLHMCHELWEQADMYMTRSHSKDFFKEVADKSEKLSLHSSIKELASYLQTGLSLLKSGYC